MATDSGYNEMGREAASGGVVAGAGVGGFFLGMLAGAVVAGVAVLLFAPRSGKETREVFRGKAMETQQMLQERLGDVKEKVGRVRQSVQSRAEHESGT